MGPGHDQGATPTRGDARGGRRGRETGRRGSGERLRDAERTKARILACALERFAARGFDRTTIRAVAADAGIDPAMVMRYFTNKEALFNAAVRDDPELPDLSHVPRTEIGVEVARAFLRRWKDPGALTLLRVASTNQVTANQVHEAYRDQLATLAATLAPPHEARERASLVASQIVGLAVCRHILHLEPLPDMDTETLAQRIGPTLQHYLTDPLTPVKRPTETSLN